VTTVTDPGLVPFEEALSRYEPVMGLEVHVELNTATKMFCGCPTVFGGEPNTHVCPICLGLPGSLPVVNGTAVESAIRIGLALNCSIAEECRFARKNYFYPDMPKNFQTSQYDEPIASGGWVDVVLDGPDGAETYRVEIERAHMEEDTGKSLHVGGSTGRIHGAEYSLLDYNRAGIPLIEIVTRPIVVPGTGHRWSPAPTSSSCATSSSRSASPTRGWTRGRCDATSTSRCGRPARRRWGPGARPRTSTRSGPSSGRSATR
jgi:aspartyl-tRNA(Asn)/glutamyl-tRNA(Gln) amidotransferase subunit B